MNHCLAFIYLFLYVVSWQPTSAQAVADEYDRLRERWKTNLTGGSAYDPADTLIARRIAAITQEAQTYWQRMDKTPDRKHLWADVVSAAMAPEIQKSYARLRAMALAHETKGSALYRDAALRQAVVEATEWLYTHRYNPTIPRHQDYRWWYWQIGAPLQLNDILVLLYDAFTPDQIARYMAAVGHYNPDFNHIVRPGQAATGANRVWMFTIQAVRGVLLKDATKLADARDGLSDRADRGRNSVFTYATTGDGFYPDGSFLQHGKFAYTGGYGNSLLNNLASLLDLLAGTSGTATANQPSHWQVTDPELQNVYRWVREAYEPLLYKGAMMDMVRGREVSRYANTDHGIGHSILNAIIRLSRFAPDSAGYKSLVKAMILSDTYRNFFAYAPIPVLVQARQIVNDPRVVPRPELILHKQFSNMDRVVHLRPGFGLGLSMSSSRLYNYESINNENLKGWYHAEGTTYLYNNDLGHYGDDYWATVDAQRLPGTTVDTRRREPVSLSGGKAYLSPNNWVGGAVLDNQYGVAGMDLRADGSTLRAHKSWFMFDDEIVCLGSGISSTDNRPIETIVENRRLNTSGSNALTISRNAGRGQLAPSKPGWSQTLISTNWLHLAGPSLRRTGSAGSSPGEGGSADIGYYFPTPATINGLRETRTGTWADLNQNTPDSTKHTRHYLTLWFTHPANPVNASYAYVLLPGKTGTQVADYARKPGTRIIANTPSVQAVKDIDLNITGFTFWTDSVTTADLLTTDRKAAILLRETPSVTEVAISDPTQANTGTINVTINRRASGLVYADKGVTVRQLSPIIKLSVDVNQAKGSTFKARFATQTK